MPFDGTDAAITTATLAVLRGALDHFGDGENWTQNRLHDGKGGRCIVGAMRRVRRTHGVRGDKTRHYLCLALRLRGYTDPDKIMAFDGECSEYESVWEVLMAALQLLEAEMRGQSRPVLKP